GLGKIALIKVLEYLWQVNGYLRAYAVVVDCLNESAESFYRQYGFEFLCEQHGRKRLFLPMKTLEQLFHA
ncbi:MAG: GNAT family N-acetyltransferase, partial [Plesiomonas sp.]